MELLVNVQNAKVDYLDKTVLDISEVKIYRGDRIGIVAPNGSGKTTLLKVLSGDIKPKGAEVHRYGRIALMTQQAEPEYTSPIDPKQQHLLNIPDRKQNMSGGEKTKRKFLETLYSYPDVLLLDEPSAHMDESGIQYIVEELKFYYGAFVLVSHDRKLLNNLVDKIWIIRDQKLITYSGNYDEYKEQRTAELERMETTYTLVQKEKKRLRQTLQDKKTKANKVTDRKGNREFKAKSTNMTKSKETVQKNLYKSAKNLEKRLENLVLPELPQSTDPVRFEAAYLKELHNKLPIIIEYIDLKAENRLLIQNINLQVPLGSKLSIIGKNGVGKTTLLKAIYKQEDGITISNKAKIGYFDQMSYLQFQSEHILSIIDYCKRKSDYDEKHIRHMLGKVNFKQNDVYKKLCDLSGGEATRLALMMVFIQDYNILLLDEPTNFLDIETIEVVEEFIVSYPGTVLCASHDNYFVNKISDIIYEISDLKLVVRERS